MPYYLGIDLGGTNIAAAVLDEEYRIMAEAARKTACPRPAEAIMDDMAAAAQEAAQKAGIRLQDVEYVGVGCPGSVNPDSGDIQYANNLDFHNVPMGKHLGDRLGRPIRVENDANAAAYGEYLAGAAAQADIRNFVAITLGTGVGGGVILGGRIYSGSNHAGGELGHMVIQAGGRPCTCGRKGCWEAYASATGLIQSTREAMRADPDSALWQTAEGGLSGVNGRTAFDGMRAGDGTAARVVREYVEALAAGLTNIINIFQPDLVSLAGGISKEGDALLLPLREIVDREDYARFGTQRTRIAIAELGNDAGVIGAALLGVSKA
ncbi:MAG TPA: ROK family protein [Firmicutes bacterium]|nr:ROK family protein [Bacillota bacterium]